MFALQRMGVFTLDEAVDGVDALKKFTEGAFDIVLTDINMPQMDGLKLVSHIRTAMANTSVPIVVITTEAAEEDRNRAMKLGASAYLVKPVQAKEVQDAVRALLRIDA